MLENDARDSFEPLQMNRYPCEFHIVMTSCPAVLRKGSTNIFQKIATPLRTGEWRTAGLRLVYQQMALRQAAQRKGFRLCRSQRESESPTTDKPPPTHSHPDLGEAAPPISQPGGAGLPAVPPEAVEASARREIAQQAAARWRKAKISLKSLSHLKAGSERGNSMVGRPEFNEDVSSSDAASEADAEEVIAERIDKELHSA